MSGTLVVLSASVTGLAVVRSARRLGRRALLIDFEPGSAMRSRHASERVVVSTEEEVSQPGQVCWRPTTSPALNAQHVGRYGLLVHTAARWAGDRILRRSADEGWGAPLRVGPSCGWAVGPVAACL